MPPPDRVLTYVPLVLSPNPYAQTRLEAPDEEESDDDEHIPAATSPTSIVSKDW
jgi:hypothetical protein